MISYTISEFLAVIEPADKLSYMDAIKNIGAFFSYLLHPSKLLLLLWNWTFELSYFICLFIALYGFFMVLCGDKSKKKYLGGSLISYFFINVLNYIIVG
ncbi:MAG TPA: hypothetical protein DCM59_16200 [Clostridium sp.]|nr:hypothetical protein [Clostridium sp.]